MGYRRALPALAVCLAACGDNNHPGGGTLLVSPQTGLYTDEAGTEATFTIGLSGEPDEPIVVQLTSMNIDEGTVSPRQLTFTKANYMRAQTVTITGVDDDRADGDRPYTVRVGTDVLGSYEIEVVNGDDDTAGVAVTPIVGLMTTEGGTQATFTVALMSEPTALVTVPIASSDASEGSVSVPQLTFGASNWNVPQTVTIDGVQDDAPDGSVAYSIVLGALTSADLGYDGFDPDDVQVLNVDDDVFGFGVTPTTGLAVSEAGAQATFSVVLQTQPTADVTIDVTSSAPDEATASTSELVFTASNWNTPQTVTITGEDDSIDDDSQPFTIVLGAATSTDPEYDGGDPADVSGTTSDDDTADVLVTAAGTLTTTEGGAAETFTVRLATQPTAPLTIAVMSSDTTEGTVSPAMLSFSTSNWMTPQTVTVTGVNDSATDGDVPYTVALAAPVTTDTKYAGIDPADLDAVNKDNDVPGVTIDPASDLVVSEYGDADQVTIALNTPPAANVVIALSSSDTSEGTVLPSSLTFTPANWNVPQTVTVTGQDDAIADGDIAFSVVTEAAASADSAYDGLAVPDIAVTNLDNDKEQVVVDARKRLLVSENGMSATFRVGLVVAPTATVTCTLSSSDPSEATVSPTTLTFQPTDFDFRTVTVTGVDDNLVDNDVGLSIVLAPCTSADPAYDGSNPLDVAVLNRDND